MSDIATLSGAARFGDLPRVDAALKTGVDVLTNDRAVMVCVLARVV
jgi:hypothetical protein